MKQIAAGTGISLRSLRTYLPRLVSHGLLLRHGQRDSKYSVSPSAELDKVAAGYGQHDYEERQAEQFARNREGFRAWQAQRANAAVSAENEPPADPPESPDDDYRRRLEGGMSL